MTDLILFGQPDKDRAVQLMMKDKKTPSEACRLLKEEGIIFTVPQLRRLKIKAFETLTRDHRDEKMADFLLDSIERITIEWEEMFVKYKSLYDKVETSGSTTDMILVAKEMKDMLRLSLKRMGEFTKGLEHIKTQNVTIYNNTDIMIAIKQTQYKMLSKSKPELQEDGSLLFKTPTPELVDDFHKWKFKNKKKALAVV